MIFAKSALIDAIDTAVQKSTRARADLERRTDDIVAAERARWDEVERPKWIALRDEISAAIKDRKLHTLRSIDSGRRNYPSGYTERTYDVRTSINELEAELRPLMCNEAEMAAIRAALVALDGDEVTDRNLGLLGFGASSVARIFRAATTN